MRILILALLISTTTLMPPGSALASSPPGGQPATGDAPVATATTQTPADADSPSDGEGWISRAFGGWLEELVSSVLDTVIGLVSKVFTTPDIGGNSRIKDLWGFSLGIADAALVALVMVGTGVAMVSGSFEAHYSVKELIPRLLGAVVGANLSLWFLSQAIGWSNALSQAFVSSASQGVQGADGSVLALKLGEVIVISVKGGWFSLIIAVLLLLEAITIFVQYLVRLIVVVLLAVIAPIMLVTYSLEQADTIARIWWRAVFAALVVPVVQAVLVAIAFRVFLTGDGFLGFFPGSSIVDLFFLAALLYVLIKTHSFAMSSVTSNLRRGGSNNWMKRYYQWRMVSRFVKTAKTAAVV